MALSVAKKTAAVALLDAEITIAQSVNEEGKYTQVLSYESILDGVIHTLRMDEYKGPLGVGYVRRVERPDSTSANIMHVYQDHNGPEDRASGWSTYDTNDQI